MKKKPGSIEEWLQHANGECTEKQKNVGSSVKTGDIYSETGGGMKDTSTVSTVHSNNLSSSTTVTGAAGVSASESNTGAVSEHHETPATSTTSPATKRKASPEALLRKSCESTPKAPRHASPVKADSHTDPLIRPSMLDILFPSSSPDDFDIPPGQTNGLSKFLLEEQNQLIGRYMMT